MLCLTEEPAYVAFAKLDSMPEAGGKQFLNTLPLQNPKKDNHKSESV